MDNEQLFWRICPIRRYLIKTAAIFLILKLLESWNLLFATLNGNLRAFVSFVFQNRCIVISE